MNIVTKPYESLLPFLVVDAISAQGVSFNSISVRIMDKGWAWLVSGRKLLVWKFKESRSPSAPKSRRILSPCFELQLPQTDLVHKAELIHIFFMPQNPNMSLRAITVPAALVISPEGTIRFWSNIGNERFTESSVVDMQGQEFCTLSSLTPLEYLLGTTTGSVFSLVIDISSHDPKSILVCSALATPSGLLSGIGRRVTNLFFGPMAADVGADTRRPLITVPKYSQSTLDKTGSTNRPFFVMSSTFKLRQWSRTHEGVYSTNLLDREWDLQRNIYAKLVADLNLSDFESLNFWPIDMIITDTKELLILIVTLNTSRDNAINYALCRFNPFQTGDSISNLTVLGSHSWNYSNESEDQLLALRFLQRTATGSSCFMYDRKFLFLVKTDQDILDAIDYGNQNDSILGAGMVDNHPLLFTQRDGLTSVEPVVSDRSRMNETSLQLDPPVVPPTTRQQQARHQTSSASINPQHPMIIEIDEDEENEERMESMNTDSRANVEQQSTMNRSALNQSEVNRSVDQSNVSRSADQSSVNRSMDKSTRFKADDWLKTNKDFEWVQQIDSRQYGLASETLAKLARESETLKDRKNTLLALSKLTKLAE